jgi:protein SCO1
MSRKSILYTAFFTVLVILFYLVMTRLNPDFGKARFAPISTVMPFSFINQDGMPVTEKYAEGKVFVAAYFFTTCKSICPRMNGNLKKVYEKFKDEKDFLILSHTCDPETDSAARLKRYADSMGVNTRQWVFLTGRKDSLYKQARYSYKIDDPNNNLKNADEDFLHTQFFALVDKKGNVKKIYDGLLPVELDEMNNDIVRLLKE